MTCQSNAARQGKYQIASTHLKKRIDILISRISTLAAEIEADKEKLSKIKSEAIPFLGPSFLDSVDVESEEFEQKFVRHDVSVIATIASALVKIKEKENALQAMNLQLDILQQEERLHLEVIRKEQEINKISPADLYRLISGLNDRVDMLQAKGASQNDEIAVLQAKVGSQEANREMQKAKIAMLERKVNFQEKEIARLKRTLIL